MRTGDCWQVCLLLLYCLSLPRSAVAGFRYYCDLSSEPIVTLVYEEGRYVRRDWNTTSSGLNVNNGNVSADDVYVDSGQPADSILVGANENTSSLVEAKKCSCWDLGRRNQSIHYYCAANDQITHCGVSSLTPSTFGLGHELPGCVSVQETTSFVRSVWPVLVISYLFLVCFLFFTMRGRDALSYGLGLAVPQWNTGRVERMIDHRPDRANGLMLRYFRVEQSRTRMESLNVEQSGTWGQWAAQFQMLQEPIHLGRDEWALLIREPATIPIFDALERLDNEETVPMPRSLKLKTKIYHTVKEENPLPSPATEDGNDSTNESKSDIEAHEGDPMDHPDEQSCTICYLSIDDGDRVGALECDHVFHVDCLKAWLSRRNVCPLCLMENAATPQYDADDSPGSQSGQNGTGRSEADEIGQN